MCNKFFHIDTIQRKNSFLIYHEVTKLINQNVGSGTIVGYNGYLNTSFCWYIHTHPTNGAAHLNIFSYVQNLWLVVKETSNVIPNFI